MHDEIRCLRIAINRSREERGRSTYLDKTLSACNNVFEKKKIHRKILSKILLSILCSKNQLNYECEMEKK